MSEIKLGIIGMSEGNGHPYSWAAIFNGFNAHYMNQCPFPGIPVYLSQQNYPDDFLSSAYVTHVWSQDPSISQSIAQASRIPRIAQSLEQMAADVDAVLLARDDAENHLQYARPFLEAGLPIFIDKPLAHTLVQAEHLLSLEKYEGQIFSCSALRHAHEFELNASDKEFIESVKIINAYIPKDWKKYAIHIIEPTLKILGFDLSIEAHQKLKTQDITQLSLRVNDDLIINFYTLGQIKHPVSIEYIGETEKRTFIFKDAFYAFRETLRKFIEQIQSAKRLIELEETLQVIRIIEMGL